MFVSVGMIVGSKSTGGVVPSDPARAGIITVPRKAVAEFARDTLSEMGMGKGSFDTTII